MKLIILPTATIEHLRTLNAEQIMDFWQTTHRSNRFAMGPGSKRYTQAVVNFASNLSTFLNNPAHTMYRDIAEKCAEDAAKLIAKYGSEAAP